MTPSTKRKASATDRLRELEAAVVAAEAAEAAARSKRTSSARWLPRAQAELAAFLIAVENGERDHDAAVERELRDRVQDLEALRGAEDTPGRFADRRAVQRHEDALLAVQDAQSDVGRFIAGERDELQAEMTMEALAVRDRLLSAVDELSAAAGAWNALARRWRGVGERWDIAPAEIPRNPLPLEDIELTVMQIRGGAKDPRGALPMPVRLAPDSNPDELIYAGSLRGWHHVVRVISSEGGLGA